MERALPIRVMNGLITGGKQSLGNRQRTPGCSRSRVTLCSIGTTSWLEQSRKVVWVCVRACLRVRLKEVKQAK